MGFKRSVSRVPGAPPRTSTPAVAPASARMTVHPVGRRGSVKCPILIPATSQIQPDGVNWGGEIEPERNKFEITALEEIQRAANTSFRKALRVFSGLLIGPAHAPWGITGGLSRTGKTHPEADAFFPPERGISKSLRWRKAVKKLEG